MPTVDFRYLTLVRALEDDLLLAEPLFFPELSTLDADRAKLVRALGERVRETVEALPAGDVYRRRPAGAPRTAEIAEEVVVPLSRWLVDRAGLQSSLIRLFFATGETIGSVTAKPYMLVGLRRSASLEC